MSTMSLRLPESLHQKVRELAEKEWVSINQLVTTALAEKISALLTAEYIEARAAKGSRDKYLEVLSKVPDAEPESGDQF